MAGQTQSTGYVQAEGFDIMDRITLIDVSVSYEGFAPFDFPLCNIPRLANMRRSRQLRREIGDRQRLVAAHQADG